MLKAINQYRTSELGVQTVSEEAASNVAILGIYIVTSRIFDILENTKQ